MRRLFPLATVLALGTALLASPAHADDVTVSAIPSLSGSYASFDPIGVDIDASGGRWIASFTFVSYFPRGSTTATRTITGASTGFSTIGAVAVDDDGHLYVADAGNDSIRIFAPGVNGNVAPERVITGASTLFSSIDDIDVDSAGYIHVVDNAADSLSTFSPAATGNASPIHRVVGPRTQLDGASGVVRRGSKLYVTSTASDAVLVFAFGQSGDVGPERAIGGSRSRLLDPTGIEVDDAGNLYVTNSGGSSRHLVIFGATADGNATPRRVVTVSGRSTSYNSIAIDRWRNLTLAHISNSRTDQLAPLITQVASAPRAAKVSGATKAASRTITWAPPASDGFAAITAYQVVVKSGSSTKYSVTRTAAQRSLPMTKSKLGKGTKTALVRARNVSGWGPWATVRFSVK